VYFIGHQSKDEFSASFGRFVADPEWIKVRDASEASGKIGEKIDALFYTALPFSPMK
jgi:hypothetical protein